MNDFQRYMLFASGCMLLLSVSLFMGCESSDSGSSGQSGDTIDYTDTASGSFAADTNAIGYGIDTSTPTNLPQPLSDEQLNNLANTIISNFTGIVHMYSGRG